MKKRKIELTHSCDEIILNVGGTAFSTCLVTLQNAPDSMLFTRFVSNKFREPVLFIDRDPTLFRHILNWLRSKHLDRVLNTVAVLSDLLIEARFFCLMYLEHRIVKRISMLEKSSVGRNGKQDLIIFAVSMSDLRMKIKKLSAARKIKFRTKQFQYVAERDVFYALVGT